MKRDVLPAACQDTQKRSCQSTRPMGIHISYSLPFLLGKRFGGKIVPTSKSHLIHANFFIRLLPDMVTRCLTIIQWLRNIKSSYHYYKPSCSWMARLMNQGSSAIINSWCSGSLQPQKEGKRSWKSYVHALASSHLKEAHYLG